MGNEEKYLLDALHSNYHGGGGPYTKKCHDLLETKYNIGKTLLTTSCTDALEMCAFLVNGNPGDEFITPSYTFSSTANAFASKGMIPVYCDVRPDTLNIDEAQIESLITSKTKAIVVIHYAGIPAEMNKINKIGEKHNIPVIEDAAQAVNSQYHDRYAGSLSELGAFSFHVTKSYSAGEGGALTMNNDKYFERSEFLWEKGTDRSLVLQGQKNKYSWVDFGSSFLPSDLLAALLFAQLENREKMEEVRQMLHNDYMKTLEPFNGNGLTYLTIPDNIKSNYHAFWVMLESTDQRESFLKYSLSKGVSPYIGYVPLHTSPKGIELGGDKYNLPVTDKAGKCVVRLPFYLMSEEERDYTCSVIGEAVEVSLNHRQ
jgi:dTDP-4-amino-4,6-dideoxygalactose transaminase